jgi:predicted aspartyl protease
MSQRESENRLLKIPTGDGMALIFYHSPEDPVECALEIGRALKEQHSNLRLRMGVNSGPVSGVVDVNGRANVAGAGINMAQRLMDCGDAGHILLSKRVAEDLEQFKHWRPHLYHLGECEVKHGDKIEIVNLFTAELGNRELPEKFKSATVEAANRHSGSEPGRGERNSQAGHFKMAIDWLSSLYAHRCVRDRQLSFLATTKAEKFRPRIGYSRKKHCGDAL